MISVGPRLPLATGIYALRRQLTGIIVHRWRRRRVVRGWRTYDSEARLRLVRWQPQRKNTLRGFATVELPIGLVIFECPVHTGVNGRHWAALPAKPQIDVEGRHRRDANGKSAWSPGHAVAQR